MKDDKSVSSNQQDQEDIDALRREALTKLGKLSAVTSATMLTLLLSGKASAQSGGLPEPPPPPGG